MSTLPSSVHLEPILELMADSPFHDPPPPVRRRFVQLLDALERTRARYAVCGAVALGAHGVERYTKDIDVLIAEEDLDALLAALSRSMQELGRLPAAGPAKQVKLRSRRARTAAGVDIDLLVPVDAVEAWALATAVRGRAYHRKVDVVSAEALVVMKLRAYLSDPDSLGMQHRVDAMRLLTTGAVDIAEMRRFLASKPELATELESILASPPPRGRIPR